MNSIYAELASTSTMLFSHCCAGNQLSFLEPQGPIASIQRTHFLEMLGLLAVFVALPIFLLIPFFAWRYRYGARSSRYTPKWRNSWLLEVAAWSGPLIIVGLLGTLVWRSTHALDPYRPIVSPTPPLRVQVIGYDWKWLFIYPDQGVASIGELALPVGRPLALTLTSATVMQSMHIPALGSQIYAMGGMVTQLHLMANGTGRFMGQNTMYNGDGFNQQKFTAVAMTTADFRKWITNAQQQGRLLDTDTLKTIALPSTYQALIHALVPPSQRADAIYFRGVSADLFPAVVKATIATTPVKSKPDSLTAAVPAAPDSTVAGHRLLRDRP